MAPVVWAILSLLLGAAVYLFDRPAGTAYLLPVSWGRDAGSRPLLAGVGDSLPSLVHAFAFSILTILVLPRTARWTATACVFWAALDSAFELAQQQSIAPQIAQAIGGRFDAVPVLGHLNRYLLRGTFDWLDLVCGLAGALLAFVVMRFRGPGC